VGGTSGSGREHTPIVTSVARATIFSLAMSAVLVTGPAVMASGPSASSAACSGSWTMLQHDPEHTGSSDCSAVAPLDVQALHPSWFVQTAGAVTDEPVAATVPTTTGSERMVFAGDSTGVLTAVDADSGAVAWTFDITANKSYDDTHAVSFGEIPGTAAYAVVPTGGGGGTPTLFFGGGGTLWALNATNGAVIWYQDTDPLHPSSAVEIESSPVYDAASNEIIVGNDTNESTGLAMTGLMAFDAGTGALLWKYMPQTDQLITPADCTDGTYSCPVTPTPTPSDEALSYGDDNGGGETDNACGDVWSSPALAAPIGRWAHGLVVFATGDCPAPAPGQFTNIESVFALDPVTGALAWNFPEPADQYNCPGDPAGSTCNDGLDQGYDSDDDFGASPIVTSVDDSAGDPIVVEAGKSGYVYGLDELTGREVWQVQAAQPGELTPQEIGAIGGFIGTPALGTSQGQAAVFLTSAVFTPWSGGGVQLQAPPFPGCPGPLSALGDASPPACPDTSLADSPTSPLRMASVHAVSVGSGQILWQEPLSTPTYAPATYANGVVFAPSTTSFAMEAYDADTGTNLWTFPLAAAGAGGAAIAGSDVFVGSGIAEGGETVPGPSGIWDFTLDPPAPAGQLPSSAGS